MPRPGAPRRETSHPRDPALPTHNPASPERVRFHDGECLRWRAAGSTFLAIPEAGARLLSWSLARPDGSEQPVIYWPEGGTLAGLAMRRGGNPILFPFCARSFDRGRIHLWRAADGIVRAMPLHGFARQSAFRLLSCDASGFAAALVPDDAARASYPYEYEFIVRYSFGPSSLTVDLELENRGSGPIPWSAGHHFYVALPWTTGLRRTDYDIEIPGARSFRQDDRGRLVSRPSLGRRTAMDDPALGSTTHVGFGSRLVRVTERSSGSSVVFASEFSNTSARDAAFTTWTQDDLAPYYCLEPWMGPPNSSETGVGLHMVPPGQSQRFTVTVAVQTGDGDS